MKLSLYLLELKTIAGNLHGQIDAGYVRGRVEERPLQRGHQLSFRLSHRERLELGFRRLSGEHVSLPHIAVSAARAHVGAALIKFQAQGMESPFGRYRGCACDD